MKRIDLEYDRATIDFDLMSNTVAISHDDIEMYIPLPDKIEFDFDEIEEVINKNNRDIHVRFKNGTLVIVRRSELSKTLNRHLIKQSSDDRIDATVRE